MSTTRAKDQATPSALGYRFPAEWEPHAATWLSWPHNADSWPGRIEHIPPIWARLVETLCRYEPVHILAGGGAVCQQAQGMVGHLPNVRLHPIETDDAWTRDHGPMFLVGPAGAQQVLVDWEYNAWGGKYPPFDRDNRVPAQVAEVLGARRFVPGIVLEGGAVDSNGAGSILTSEQCLLNPNRNAGMDRREMERYLRDYCAAKHVIWLGEGIVGDDTDGHIDELARFVGPRTVVAAVEQDPADENYPPLADNLVRLRAARDQDARELEIVPLTMPGALFHDNRRLPASYLNFYVANGLVIVPQFDDPADAAACETIGKLFPTREVVCLPARELVWGLGTYHCITQQQPRQP